MMLSMFMSVVALILTIVGMIVILALLAKAVVWLYTTAMTWTRVGFGLIIGLVCIQNVDPLVENGILNYLIFSGIAFACIFLLSFMNRTDCAIKFVSTFAVAWIVNGIYIGFAGLVVTLFLSDEALEVFNAWLTPVTTVVALGFAVWMTLKELRLLAPLFAKEKNRTYIMTDRTIASVIYGLVVGGVATMVLGIQATIGFLICAIIAGVAAFAADYYLLQHWVSSALEVIEE